MRATAEVRFNVSAGDDAVRDAAIEKFGEEVEAQKLASVEATIDLAGIDVVMLVEAEVGQDDELESRVMPALRALLAANGLARIAVVQRAVDADDDWDDEEDAPNDEEEDDEDEADDEEE